MEIKTILVTLFVAALGIAVAVAGFAAEAKKPKESQITVVYVGLEPECHNPGSPAMGLAIAATVALVIARAIITGATGGCCSCCQPIPGGLKFARFLIVISWLTSTIAIILFIAGAKLSGQESVETEVNGKLYCYTVRPGVFSAAGIMGLLSVLLGVVYYFLYVLAQRRAAEKPSIDLELEKPPVVDVKKPQEPLQNH